jgi:transposase
MSSAIFKEEDIAVFRRERMHSPHHIVRRKMDSLYLCSQGLSRKQVQKINGIAERTLAGYFRQYKSGGVEALRKIDFQRQGGALSSHEAKLTAYFDAHPPASIKEASSIIERETNVKRSAPQVRLFLKKLGFRPVKANGTSGDAAKSKSVARIWKRA